MDLAPHLLHPTPDTMRFAPEDPAALLESAFGAAYHRAQPTRETRSTVAVVQVRGPLRHHASGWWDSYEGIIGRVGEALAEDPSALVMSIDSPGGLVAGCFEACRSIRSMVDAAGVPLIAYVDGMAASAAYALAATADRIVVPDTGLVGSVGVIGGLMSATKVAERFGLDVRVITSGKRKSDGHLLVPISDDAEAATQARVNELAEVFFAWVAERRGMTVEAVRALEAGVMHGHAGVNAGLADAVATFDQMLAGLASGEEESMSMKMIATALGLSAGADEAQVMSAVQRTGGLVEQLRQKMGLPESASRDDILGAAVARFGEMVPKAEYDAVFAELKASKEAAAEAAKAAHDREVKQTLEEARKAGKIAPASVEHYAAMCSTPEGLERVKALFATMPAIVSDDATSDEDPPGDRAEKLTPEQLHIAKSRGMSAKEYAAYLRGEDDDE